jgi:hypothetical protein
MKRLTKVIDEETGEAIEGIVFVGWFADAKDGIKSVIKLAGVEVEAEVDEEDNTFLKRGIGSASIL